jgi:hypothetical protein
VSGGEGAEHVDHFTAATLTENKPVGPHAQCLPHEFGQPNGTESIRICLPRFERNNVRMLDPQFCGIFDAHNALIRTHLAQECRQERRLSGTRRTRNEHGSSFRDIVTQ